MKKTEKIITALLTIALGVLVIILRGELIKIITTVCAIALLALGLIDLIHKKIPPFPPIWRSKRKFGKTAVFNSVSAL